MMARYERLVLDVIRGDHNLFVRADELEASWKVFTPLLHELEKDKVEPLVIILFIFYIRTNIFALEI